MPTEAPLPKGHPILVAWDEYKVTEEYANTKEWAKYDEHVDGSLWAAFVAGWSHGIAWKK